MAKIKKNTDIGRCYNLFTWDFEQKALVFSKDDIANFMQATDKIELLIWSGRSLLNSRAERPRVSDKTEGKENLIFVGIPSLPTILCAFLRCKQRSLFESVQKMGKDEVSAHTTSSLELFQRNIHQPGCRRE